MAWLITSEAIQIYGGYGYCSDYPVEQLARDSKILAIWEGTNGIQSIDLAMRKLLMNPGGYNYLIFKKRIKETIQAVEDTVDASYIEPVKIGLGRMDEIMRFLEQKRDSNKIGEILARATPLQQAFRMLSHAWMHLWSLSITIPRLKEESGGQYAEPAKASKENGEAAFYFGKVLSSRFYISNEFKKFEGLASSILSEDTAVLDTVDEIFTGAPEQ
jgi:hypothetical protein